MAWVRLHDGALTHPKIAGLFDWKDPLHVWLWGLSQSQMHLTDGMIQRDSVPKPALKAVEVLVQRRLWEPHDIGWKIHDYLTWNDSRERVLERRAASEAERNATRDRMKRWRDVKAARRGVAVTPDVTASPSRNVTPDVTPSQSRNVTGIERVTGDVTLRSKPTQPNPISTKSATHSGPPKEPADPRVREFLKWFQAEYRTRRHGADYLVQWDRDGRLVKQMLGATELPRLQKLAQILLSDKTDEPFISETDRGIGILSVKFNWLSERLAAWEAKRAASA